MGGCPSVGIGGLTLGGGIGTLMPKYGAACDNLQSADVVTVDSRLVKANHNSNSDLFWAIRGGGGNFGVAASFEYRLYPVTEVLAGGLEYPAGRISELLRTYQKFTATAPDEIMLVAMIVSSKQGPRFRIRFRYCGDPSVGNQLLRSLREPIKPEDDSVKVMSYLEAQVTEFPQPPKPLPYFETSLFLRELNETAIAAINSNPRCTAENQGDDVAPARGCDTHTYRRHGISVKRIRACTTAKGRLGNTRRGKECEAMDKRSSCCSESFFARVIRQSPERTERQVYQGGVWTKLWGACKN
jgi:hypothetical protein